jgi:hypothetical protein
MINDNSENINTITTRSSNTIERKTLDSAQSANIPIFEHRQGNGRAKLDVNLCLNVADPKYILDNNEKCKKCKVNDVNSGYKLCLQCYNNQKAIIKSEKVKINISNSDYNPNSLFLKTEIPKKSRINKESKILENEVISKPILNTNKPQKISGKNFIINNDFSSSLQTKNTNKTKKNCIDYLDNLTIPKLRQLCQYFNIYFIQKNKKEELIDMISRQYSIDIISNHIETIKNKRFMVECTNTITKFSHIFYISKSILLKEHNELKNGCLSGKAYCNECKNLCSLIEYVNAFFKEI